MSLINKEKRWKKELSDDALISKLSADVEVSPFVLKILLQRGITTVKGINEFLAPQLENLHDPFLMQDMEPAVLRLKKAIHAGEKILLYGDYDVDGTTAVATLGHFLTSIDVSYDFYIPDRYKEGYGVSLKGVEYARDHGISLMIAMDCGIRAFSASDLAKDYGIDLIICDHHLPAANLPNAFAILDPLRADCTYPYKYLSGCGVTFKFIQAYCQKHELPDQIWHSLLDLLVVSIAADIVPITGENRILAKFGLQLLNKTKRPGLLSLLKTSHRAIPLSITDVVFGLAPLINAAGRMADGRLAVSLLLSQDEKKALELAQQLDYQNKLRREFEQRITAEAKQLFMSREKWEDDCAIVVFKPHWHKGVVGIVASRLVEQFHKPAIVLTESEGKIVGSARSVKGFDIHQAIGHCEMLLMNFGGHKHAAGLSLLPHNLAGFKDCLEGYVCTNITAEQKEPTIAYNKEIDLSEIDEPLFKTLEQLAPFGPGNRNPVFVTRGVMNAGGSRLLKEEHLRLVLKQGTFTNLNIHGIAFFMGEHASDILEGHPFDICYSLNQNKWKGRINWQLTIKDIKIQEIQKNK